MDQDIHKIRRAIYGAGLANDQFRFGRRINSRYLGNARRAK